MKRPQVDGLGSKVSEFDGLRIFLANDNRLEIDAGGKHGDFCGCGRRVVFSRDGRAAGDNYGWQDSIYEKKTMSNRQTASRGCAELRLRTNSTHAQDDKGDGGRGATWSKDSSGSGLPTCTSGRAAGKGEGHRASGNEAATNAYGVF